MKKIELKEIKKYIGRTDLNIGVSYFKGHYEGELIYQIIEVQKVTEYGVLYHDVICETIYGKQTVVEYDFGEYLYLID